MLVSSLAWEGGCHEWGSLLVTEVVTLYTDSHKQEHAPNAGAFVTVLAGRLVRGVRHHVQTCSIRS